MGGGIVVVTGTNGKTTTTKMLAAVMTAHGKRVFTNPTGSNFTRGVISAMLKDVSLAGRLDADVAVLELDEWHALQFAKVVKPTHALLLNVARDQLDRFAEIDTTARLLTTLATQTTEGVVLNRDDSFVARVRADLPEGLPVRYFGIDPAVADDLPSLQEADVRAGDAVAVPPPPPATACSTRTTSGASRCASVRRPSARSRCEQRGLAAMINATAATTMARMLLGDGFSEAASLEALARVTPPFGRGEVIDADGHPLELVLVKNPAGFTVALGTYGSEPVTTMVAINDDYADGQDVSWLYDVSFESLRGHGVALTSGVRAYDMALRLDYDDVAGRGDHPGSGGGARHLPHGIPAPAAADLLHVYRDDAAAPVARRPLRPVRASGRRRYDVARAWSTSSTSIPARCRSTATSATPGVWRHGSGGTATTSSSISTTRVEACPEDPHLFMGGGGQDSGQSRVEADLVAIADRLRGLASDGAPMIMICGMYQLFGNAFITVEGEELPGLGILDVTTRGNAKRMIGGVVLDTEFGEVVGFENHSGSTLLGSGQAAFGRSAPVSGNNGQDGTEGAVTGNVIGSYLHGPILPANPRLADRLIAWAAERATGRPFEPGDLDDAVADEARVRQVRRLVRA